MNPVISLLNNHDVEIRQKTLPGSIPRSDIANLLDAIARTIEKDVDYALGIPFDSMVSAMTGKQLTANDKYFVSQVGSIPGGGCVLTLKGDGSHSPDLSNFLVVSGSYSNTVNVVNQLIFYYDGANYCVAIIQLPAGAVLNTTAGSSGPDTTPPVVVSIAVLNANPSQVVITYSEGLKTTAIPAASDFVITAGGSPATINNVAVSANTVLLNLASAIIAGSSNFIQYTPGTNKIQDLAGNLAAAIPVNTLITNNVGNSDTTPPTLSSAVVNSANPNQIVLTYSETLSSTMGLVAGDFTASGKTVTAVSATGAVITITVNANYTGADTITVSGGNSKIKDVAGNVAANLTSQAVTNNISGYQAESAAFFTRADAAEGTALSSTFKNAYDAMVVSLKSASVYSKLRAMYVYPGATAAAHALNAISASFGLTFVGAVTHGAGGVTWGGGYADTGLTPSTSGMVDYSASFGFVDRTSTPHGTVDVFEMGVGDGTESWYVYTSYGSPASAYGKIGGQQLSLASSTDASGFWLVTQTTNSSQAFYRNGTLNQANSNGNFDTQPTRSVYLMAMNSSGTATTPSQHNVPFHFIGDGLSATDVTNLYNAVNTFLTAIGR